MVKKKLAFVFGVFCATVLLMAVQKPVFLAYYAADAAQASAGEWLGVVWHGLTLDSTIAGYVTALPLLLTLASLWVRLPERIWRRVLNVYFVLIAVLTAAIFAVDVELYRHWGFRLDSTVLIYLADPKEAMASVDFWLGVRQTLLAAAYVALMIWTYRRVVGLFDGEPLRRRAALPWTFGLLLLAGCDFLAIRGGTGASVANVSKVYFSSNMFLNHAATNPVFSFLTTLGDHTDYASEYPFFDETTRTAKFDALRGNGPASGPSERVLTKTRPNVVVVILESFARTIMDADVDGRPVMPNMRRLRDEGIWFENFFANSFRTDRGEVAVLSGFPAQTRMSIMKLPAKSRSLPSLARSLAREGYATSFVYGGDLNFTNQASYMYATGWQQLVWQRDLRFDTPPSDWGYDDAVMCDWFADRVIAQSGTGEPFLAGLLTLSSHRPFDVPFSRFDDRELNAFAFADDCVGRMIDKLFARMGRPARRAGRRPRLPVAAQSVLQRAAAPPHPDDLDGRRRRRTACGRGVRFADRHLRHDPRSAGGRARRFRLQQGYFRPDPPPQVRVLHLQRRLRRGRCFGRSRLGRHERESGFRDLSRPDGRGPYDAADHLYRHRKPLTAGKIPEIRYCGT